MSVPTSPRRAVGGPERVEGHRARGGHKFPRDSPEEQARGAQEALRAARELRVLPAVVEKP